MELRSHAPMRMKLTHISPLGRSSLNRCHPAGSARELRSLATPRQSCGTRLHAFFAVRKQHTKQVTPVEGQHPQWDSIRGVARELRSRATPLLCYALVRTRCSLEKNILRS